MVLSFRGFPSWNGKAKQGFTTHNLIPRMRKALISILFGLLVQFVLAIQGNFALDAIWLENCKNWTYRYKTARRKRMWIQQAGKNDRQFLRRS